MHLDLYPRENKYGHAAVWGLIPGWVKPDGSRNFPVVSMVANLAKSTPERPALMKVRFVKLYFCLASPISPSLANYPLTFAIIQHGDAVTFFHEMGHAFHGLCSHTQFARFHGTRVARDFVEAPSQVRLPTRPPFLSTPELIL